MIEFKLRGWLVLVFSLWLTAAWCGAETLQDWSSLAQGFAGTFADKEGSAIDLQPAQGPGTGEKAVKVTAHIVSWAGIWAGFRADLSRTGAIRFWAKASKPEIIEVGLLDQRNIQYIAVIRLVGEDWREFVIPLSLFKKGVYQMPEAPKDKPFDWSRIESLQLLPQTHGDVDLQVGPISFQKGKAKAETGIKEEKNAVTVQDFTFLDKTAYGPYTDGKTGTTIALTLKNDPDGKGNRLADIHYLLKPGGWGGYWMRAGDAWGGQDWTGAKTLSLEVYTSVPMEFQIGFNDTNQNAYVAKTGKTRGNGWEKMELSFKRFELNPYYQPPDAKKGMAQDLTHVETLNVAPLEEGSHDFQIREITLRK